MLLTAPNARATAGTTSASTSSVEIAEDIVKNDDVISLGVADRKLGVADYKHFGISTGYSQHSSSSESESSCPHVCAIWLGWNPAGSLQPAQYGCVV